MTNIGILLLAIGAISWGGFVLGKNQAQRRLARKLRQLDFFQQIWREQTGNSKEFGSYHLISLDAGKTWISVKDGEIGYEILGTVEPFDPTETETAKETKNQGSHGKPTDQGYKESSNSRFKPISFNTAAAQQVEENARRKFRGKV